MNTYDILNDVPAVLEQLRGPSCGVNRAFKNELLASITDNDAMLASESAAIKEATIRYFSLRNCLVKVFRDPVASREVSRELAKCSQEIANAEQKLPVIRNLRQKLAQAKSQILEAYENRSDFPASCNARYTYLLSHGT